MAIPSRQIGWSTKSNLLWQISKQLEALSGIMYNRGNPTTTTTTTTVAPTTTTTSTSTSTTTSTSTSTSTTTTTTTLPPVTYYYNVTGYSCGTPCNNIGALTASSIGIPLTIGLFYNNPENRGYSFEILEEISPVGGTYDLTGEPGYATCTDACVPPTTTTTTTAEPTTTTTSTSTSTTTTTTTLNPALFSMTVDTNGTGNNTVVLPYLDGETYAGTINWGDGNITANSYATREHTYASGSTYQIIIDGTIGYFNYRNGANPEVGTSPLVSVNQFGNQFSFGSDIGGYFFNCRQLVSLSEDISFPLSSINNLSYMFSECYVFNQNIDGWNMTGKTNISYMFQDCAIFNKDLNTWDVSSVTNMEGMFYGAQQFNGNIGSWDVSNVTKMETMFNSCTAFNQDISAWNVASLTNAVFMFNSCLYFNSPIFTANNLINAFGMFQNAYIFNQDISGWNVSSVTDMGGMFVNCLTFNQNISGWNVGNVTNMNSMFYNSSVFNQDLSSWCVTNIPIEPSDFATSATSWVLPKPVWGSCPEPTTTTTTTTANPTLFLMTVDTNITGPYEVVLPYDEGATYTGTIDWGDGTITANSYATRSHSYVDNNILQITIDGEIGYWNTGFVGSSLFPLTSIDQFGTQFNFGNDSGQYFVGLSNLTTIAYDIPLAGITNMNLMFSACNNFNSDISGWDVSAVTSMSGMFYGAGSFDRTLSTWNVGLVTDMSNMFTDAYQFGNISDAISGWDVSSVTTMSSMFQNATSFDQDLYEWNVSNVSDFTSFLNGATTFSSSKLGNIYNGWSALPSLQTGVTFDASFICYPDDEYTISNRQLLIDTYGWTIQDAGVCAAPITQVTRYLVSGSNAVNNGEFTMQDYNLGADTTDPNSLAVDPLSAVLSSTWISLYSSDGTDESSYLFAAIESSGYFTMTQGANSATYEYQFTTFTYQSFIGHLAIGNVDESGAPTLFVSLISPSAGDFNYVDPVVITI